MNRNQLEYFVAAAESRSFTRAAERFYISQTAITQQIRLLEGMLGCPLFDRSTRPVSLTGAGRAFLTEAKAILERMDRAAELVREASVGLNGTLRVGYVRGYERSDLSNRVQRFHAENPNILVSFYRAPADRLAAGLLGGEYDVIFTWDSTNLMQDPAVGSEHVESARLVAALYSRHPLAHRRRLTRAELAGEALIYMSPSETNDSYGDAQFMELYRRAGYKPNIVFRTSDTESALMMVASEEGISILPGYCTEKLAGADNLVFIPLEGEDEVEEIIAAYRRDNGNPALARFLETNER